jgi:hypothetical protein
MFLLLFYCSFASSKTGHFCGIRFGGEKWPLDGGWRRRRRTPNLPCVCVCVCVPSIPDSGGVVRRSRLMLLIRRRVCVHYNKNRLAINVGFIYLFFFSLVPVWVLRLLTVWHLRLHQENWLYGQDPRKIVRSKSNSLTHFPSALYLFP